MVLEKPDVPGGSGDLCYEPMPDAGTHIRLLKILTAEEDRPVECTLKTWPKDDAPPYIAISYTWGDPAENTLVVVDKRNLGVRSNCDYVLRQASSYDISQYYWLDAICINQADAVEKGMQVRQMGNVYESASRTLICVGRGANNFELTFQTIERFSALLEHIGKHAVFTPGGLAPALRFRGFWKWYFRVRSKTLRDLGDATSYQMDIEYNYRAWVCQETAMGYPLVVCQGKYWCPLERFAGLMYALQYEGQLSRSSGGQRVRLPDRLFRQISRLRRRTVASDVEGWFKRMEIWGPNHSVGLNKHLPTLSDLLHIMPLTKCSDPRDRIFSTLALTGWGEGDPLQPDYNMWPFDLAVEVIQRLFLVRPQKTVRDAMTLTRMLELRPPPQVSGLAMPELPGWRDVNDSSSKTGADGLLISVQVLARQRDSAMQSNHTLQKGASAFASSLDTLTPHSTSACNVAKAEIELHRQDYMLEVDSLPGIGLVSRASADGMHKVIDVAVEPTINTWTKDCKSVTVWFDPQDLFRLVIFSMDVVSTTLETDEATAEARWNDVTIFSGKSYATWADLKHTGTDLSGETL